MATTVGNRTISDQEIKDWWGTGKTPGEIAQDATGWTADQITQGLNATGAYGNPVTNDQVNNWVSDKNNGYEWDAAGALQKKAPVTPGGLVNNVRSYTPKEVATTGYTPTNVTTEGYAGQGMTATPPAPAEGYTAAGYTPERITGQESVSEALDRIINGDSPLMQTAATTAKQGMNSRGLLNTSMAVGAGQDAVIRNALPIAQGDVATSLSVKSANQNATNTASQFLAQSQNMASQFLAAAKNQNGLFTAEQANQAAQFSASASNVAAQFTAAAKNAGNAQNAAAGNAASQFAADAQNAAASQNAEAFNKAMSQYADAMNKALYLEFQAGQETATQVLKGTQATALADIEATYRTTIQTSASAASLFTSITNAMTVTQSDANTTAEQKEKSIARLTAQLKAGLAVIGGAGGGTIDLTSLLNFEVAA